jgi:glycosyltransferase involved in cell wall biosynthesis
MPTPYQLDFFASLKKYFELEVVYFSVREADRQWDLPTEGIGYKTIVLNDNLISRFVHRWIPSFHFSTGIKTVVKEDNPSFVIVNGTYWTPNVALILYLYRNHNTKTAYWSEPVFDSQGLMLRLKRLMLYPILKWTDYLFAIGTAARDSFLGYGYARPIINIPYNIDMLPFKEIGNEDLSLVLNVLGNPGKEEIIILTSGSLINRKGIDTVIKAFKSLKSSKSLRLVIMGDGEERRTLTTLADGDSRIKFIGFQEKHLIPYWFKAADIFVFASRYDGWGLVINEAIAGDAAIICSTAVGAGRDLLQDGVNGFLVDPENVEGFATAMTKLITDTSLRESFVKNNSENAERLSSDYNAKLIYGLCIAT